MATQRPRTESTPRSAREAERVARQAPQEVRIIGGRFKRSPLSVPTWPGLRPTSSRVRETLFNWLGQDLAGWRVLDAFAGSGALGLEAASRGAESVAMLEREPVLARGIEANVRKLGALGYSLADRGIRLDEARTLITKALELRPGDPYITDSLGWLEFRAGHPQEAVKWLRQAYVTKSDTEIAAHLGEVLWTLGEQDEALRIWREGIAQDPRNETLRETLKRLKAPL